MAKDTFAVDPVTGLATIYEKKNNKPKTVWPVDAREILQSSDDYSPQPAKTITDTSKSAETIEIKVPTHTLESLEKMNKKELTNLAANIGLDVPLTLTGLQIKDMIIEKLELLK